MDSYVYLATCSVELGYMECEGNTSHTAKL